MFRPSQTWMFVSMFRFEWMNGTTIFSSEYDPGDEIHILAYTSRDPNKTGKSNNWIVRTKNGESVWSSLRMLKDRGIIELLS